MEFKENKSGGGITYLLKGRFTYADHASFRNILRMIGGGDLSHLVFDLSDVEFIDSAGMGMLLLANDTAEKAGVALKLRGATGQVKRLFEGQKFASVFALES